MSDFLMFKEMEQKADWLQDEVWKLVADKSGFARTQENSDRMRSIWAATIAATLKNLGINDPMLEELPPPEKATPFESILALALVSAAHAESAAAKEDKEALDLLVVAAETAGIVRGLLTLPDSEAQKSAGALLAKLRHAESRDMKELAINYWRDHIDPNISAAKAADKLLGVVNLSHKKLAEIISAEKKKLV